MEVGVQAGWMGAKGETWDNCDSINNKIFLKMIDILMVRSKGMGSAKDGSLVSGLSG